MNAAELQADRPELTVCRVYRDSEWQQVNVERIGWIVRTIDNFDVLYDDRGHEIDPPWELTFRNPDDPSGGVRITALEFSNTSGTPRRSRITGVEVRGGAWDIEELLRHLLAPYAIEVCTP